MTTTRLFKKKNVSDDQNTNCDVNSMLYNHFQMQFDKLVKKIENASIECIETYVVKGEQNDIIFFSFPTANTFIEYEKIKRIKSGFIFTKTEIRQNVYNSISFVNKNNNLIKTYIFNFNKNIYGEKIKITFLNSLITMSNKELEDKNRIKELFILSIEKANKYICNYRKLF